MEVQLTPEQEAFVREAVASGRVGGAEEAVQQALYLWEERERARFELLLALDEAELDFAEGRFTTYAADGTSKLADELKLEARQLRASKLRR